jgi:hypothetical protein
MFRLKMDTNIRCLKSSSCKESVVFAIIIIIIIIIITTTIIKVAEDEVGGIFRTNGREEERV